MRKKSRVLIIQLGEMQGNSGNRASTELVDSSNAKTTLGNYRLIHTASASLENWPADTLRVPRLLSIIVHHIHIYILCITAPMWRNIYIIYKTRSTCANAVTIKSAWCLWPGAYFCKPFDVVGQSVPTWGQRCLSGTPFTNMKLTLLTVKLLIHSQTSTVAPL